MRQQCTVSRILRNLAVLSQGALDSSHAVLCILGAHGLADETEEEWQCPRLATYGAETDVGGSGPGLQPEAAEGDQGGQGARQDAGPAGPDCGRFGHLAAD